MPSTPKPPQRAIQLKLFRPARNEPSREVVPPEVQQQVRVCWRASCAITPCAGKASRCRRGIVMNDKIKPQHLSCKAILYIRQSSAYQVHHNLESQRLQYVMQERLQQLGWREIEVVDEDLGRSAAGLVTRSGFERMVADVCLGKVGAVAAREVSRFARNSRDWQQLVEVCRVVDTVLIDQDTVYAPRESNDRLLLGLKGSLNEYEPDLLRLFEVRLKQKRLWIAVQLEVGAIPPPARLVTQHCELNRGTCFWIACRADLSL
jgi:Resolvase, N terminal domain